MSGVSAAANSFRRWAATQNRSFGEWECDYPAWSEVYASLVQALDDGTWTDDVEDLVYLLARDNECEIVQTHLFERPEQLFAMAAAITSSNESDARWQLAAALGRIGTARTWPLLSALSADTDEYVRRRALLAMADAHHPDVERVARTAWSTGEQYPQLAALDVLCRLGVPDAPALLSEARSSPHPYLAARASKISNT